MVKSVHTSFLSYLLPAKSMLFWRLTCKKSIKFVTAIRQNTTNELQARALGMGVLYLFSRNLSQKRQEKKLMKQSEVVTTRIIWPYLSIFSSFLPAILSLTIFVEVLILFYCRRRNAISNVIQHQAIPSQILAKDAVKLSIRIISPPAGLKMLDMTLVTTKMNDIM